MSEQLTMLSPPSSYTWRTVKKAAYRSLGGEEQSVLIDAGDIRGTLHDQPNSRYRQGNSLFDLRRLVVFVGIVLRHISVKVALVSQTDLTSSIVLNSDALSLLRFQDVWRSLRWNTAICRRLRV